MTWFQLTYASAAGEDGRPGGWRVLERDAGAPDGLAQLLERGVSTRLDSGEELSDHATRDELARRQHSFSFAYTSGEGCGYWHACQAGSDATGRPGNVFTHAAGHTDVHPATRPISLMRSPSWMTPFGHREVSASHLRVFEPVDGRSRVRDVLERAVLDPERTEALLAAVAHCFQENRPLVLLGESPSVVEALERVSWLTSGTVSATIPFRTYGRAADFAVGALPFRVVGIPPFDVDELQGLVDLGRSNALVLDLSVTPHEVEGAGWASGRHRWPHDPRWQNAFYLLTQLGVDAAVEIVDAMDEICAGLRPEDLLSPSWPLALALLQRLGERCPDRAELSADWRRTRPWDALRDARLRDLLEVDEYVPSVLPAGQVIESDEVLTGEARAAVEGLAHVLERLDGRELEVLRARIMELLGGAVVASAGRQGDNQMEGQA